MSPHQTQPSDLWPAFGLVLAAGDLELAPVSDDDLPGLVDLALDGIHEPGTMPFLVPWTLAPREELPRRFAQFHWYERARSTPDSLHLNFSVRRGGELVGTQGFNAEHFAVTRTAETGSWLGRRHQGQGIGTRMRQMVGALLFDHLGATQLTSGAFLDNPASLAVSRKVGYRSNGFARHDRLGTLATHELLVLDPADFVRGDPVRVSGVEPLRAYLAVRPT